MSELEVAATVRPGVRTAREPDEDLNLPWEAMREEEKRAEVLAALRDPSVARAASDAKLDIPTVGDVQREEADPVSKNK
ncbi:unnamed protein product, partial [Discosporangium mesarthrocarpum]